MKRTVGIFLLAALACAIGHAQPVFVNFRVHPSLNHQTEPLAAIDPTNPNVMCVACRAINGPWESAGVYVTTNAGTGWFGSDTCNGQSVDNYGGDPGVAFHPSGNLVLTHIGSTIFHGIFSHTSSDFLHWSNALTIFASEVQQPDDKGQTTAIDNNPGSPYYGRLYAAWAINGIPFTVLASFSADGAQTWSAPTAINPSPPAHSSGTFTTVGLNGKVYVTWVETLPSSSVEDTVKLGVSTDGGSSWRVMQNSYHVGGVFGIYASKNSIRLNGLPQIDIDRTGGPRSGWIYIVTTEKNLAPAGSDLDIILHRSTDDGVTWSSGIRVNQDTPNNGKFQFFPAVEVDSQGGLDVIYYDDRNTTADSAEIFLSRSLDGGTTWREWVVSTHRFEPSRIFPTGYMGDHIALTSAGNILWPFWMDSSSGQYQVWTAPIDIMTLDVRNEDPTLPSTVTLEQNYPNPFNPSTTIGYDLNKSGYVSLRVFDLAGRQVAELVHALQQAGHHRVVFDTRVNVPGLSTTRRLPSGVYFYQLTVNGLRSTRSMVLLK